MILDETLKQVFYKATTNAEFGKYFSQLPLSQDYFSDNVDLAKYIQRHYYKNDSPVSMSSLLIEIENDLSVRHKNTKEDLDNWKLSINNLSDLSNSDNFSNNEEINQETDKWLRRKKFYQIITDSISNNHIGDEKSTNQLIDKLDQLSLIGSEDSKIDSIDLFNDDSTDKIIDMVKEDKKDYISTGYPSIDNDLFGGLSRGELGMIIGSYGQGKTMALTNLASNYLINGLDVCFIELEEKGVRMVMRILSTLAQKSKRKLFGLNDEDTSNYLKSIMNQLINRHKNGSLGKFELWTADSYEVGLSTIEKKLNHYFQLNNKYPDIIMIDYPELLTNEFDRNNRRDDVSMGMLYHKIRDLGSKYNSVIWTASQTNRMSSLENTITGYSISGSAQKLHAVELAITINSNKEEFENNFIRLYVDKARNHSDTFQKTLMFKVDPSCSRIMEESPAEKEEHQKLIDEMGTSSTKKGMSYSRTENELKKLRKEIE